MGPAFDTVRNGLADFGRYRAFRLAICPLFASPLVAERWSAIEASFGEAIERRLTPSPQAFAPDIDAAVLLVADERAEHPIEIIHPATLRPLATPKVRELALAGEPVPWIVWERWREGPRLWAAKSNVKIDVQSFLLAEGLSTAHTACVMGAGMALLPIEVSRTDLRAARLVHVHQEREDLVAAFALLYPHDS